MSGWQPSACTHSATPVSSQCKHDNYLFHNDRTQSKASTFSAICYPLYCCWHQELNTDIESSSLQALLPPSTESVANVKCPRNHDQPHSPEQQNSSRRLKSHLRSSQNLWTSQQDLSSCHQRHTIFTHVTSQITQTPFTCKFQSWLQRNVNMADEINTKARKPFLICQCG